jgi:hypothetical protein
MSTAGTHLARIDCAGLQLQLEAGDRDDLLLVQRLVGTAPGHGDTDAVIRIGTAAPGCPDRAPDFEGPYGDHWHAEGSMHFRHHWGLQAAIEADHAVLGGDAQGYRRWVAVRNSMLFVLARLFYERDRFVVHGAAIRRHDRGVLVVGDSGTGKSTCCYAAGRAGWSVLADDMVVVDSLGGDVRLQGVPRVPSLPGDVAAPAGERGAALLGDDRARIELDGAELDPRAVPARGVLQCAHGGGAAELVDVPTDQVVATLTSAFVLSALEVPVRRWFPLAMSLARLPHAELHHAARPERRLDGAADALARFDARLDARR